MDGWTFLSLCLMIEPSAIQQESLREGFNLSWTLLSRKIQQLVIENEVASSHSSSLLFISTTMRWREKKRMKVSQRDQAWVPMSLGLELNAWRRTHNLRCTQVPIEGWILCWTDSTFGTWGHTSIGTVDRGTDLESTVQSQDGSTG